MSAPNEEGSKKRKKGSKKRSIPQPGDPDYKTPTQLRNARKRRKQKADNSPLKLQPEDPSLRYVANPTSCPIVQQAKSFFQEEAKDFEIFVGPTTGWRTVAKLAVRMQAGCLRIGLFVPGSHDLLEVPQCRAHHPRINSCIEFLQKKCRQFGIVPYDEETGTGNLKHVAINIQRSTQTQQVTLVWNGTSAKGEDKIKLNDICNSLVDASENEKEYRVQLHSLWVHYSDAGKHDNAIFSHTGRWQKRHGDDSVIETLEVDPKLSVGLQFPPQVFRQANLDAFTNIVVKIRQWVEQHPPKRCVELYGGVGTIGLHLADLCESLVSSDENPYNRNCFDRAANKMAIDSSPGTETPNIQYEPKNASDMVQTNAFRDADLIVVDPPRKGLDDDVVEALCGAETATALVYVSCGFPAFMRDYRGLTAAGWKLDHAEGHLLFPGSDAIETLAFFTRGRR